MGMLLQLIGKGSDQQIATEAQRRASAIKLTPGKPQLRCRSIEQAGDFGFDIARVRLSCATVPVAASTGSGRRPARVLASRRIVDCTLHALAGVAMR
jgi:hypothetical protein